MVKRVKKGDWVSLLSSLSERNRFCPIIVEEDARTNASSVPGLYLIGVRLGEEDDRTHLDIYVCKSGDPRVGFLYSTTPSPQTFSVEETKQDGIRLLTVSHGKKEKIRLRFIGPLSSEVRRDSIAKLAYSFYERRGRIEGNALQDWGDAERLFSRWEQLIEQRFI